MEKIDNKNLALLETRIAELGIFIYRKLTKVVFTHKSNILILKKLGLMAQSSAHYDLW